MTRRKILSAAAFVAAGALTMTSCASGAGGDELITVDMAMSAVSILSAAPIEVAIDQGYFEENGCQIGERLESEGGASTLRLLLDGGLDMGEVGTGAVIDGYVSGAPILAVGSAAQRPYDNNWAVLKGSDITSPEDMVGKIWGITNPGGASEDLSFLIPNSLGMDPDSIERVPTNGLGGGLALLEGGDIDLALITPLVFERNKEKLEVAFETIDYIPAFQKTLYVTTEEFAESNPDGVRCVLAAINDAVAFIKDDPGAAAEIYAEAADGDFTVEELTAELELAVDRGALDGGVGFNAEGLANNALARQLRDGTDEVVPGEEFLDPQFRPEGVTTAIPKSEG